MKGNAEVIDGLNEALSEELTAINQYFLHSEMCENWGYKKLADFIKKHAVEEMKHAEALIERILFLDGMPNLSKYQKLNVGQGVPEIIKNNLALEHGAVDMYNRLIEKTGCKNGDHGTAELLKKILKDEEEHVDGLEMHETQIREMGLGVYLSVWT